MICFTIKLKGFEATYNTNPTMLSIVSRTALQCPFENILLLKQIQKYSRSKRLGYKTSKSEKGGEGDERESFPASDGERGAEKSKTRYYEDDDDGDDEATLIGPLDIDGYLKASPKYAKQHQLPPNLTELSTWNAITALVWHKHEGLLSLWKGNVNDTFKLNSSLTTTQSIYL